MDRNEQIIARQRDRAIASILDFKEQVCDEHLPNHASKGLRKKVLDNINDLSNLCIDLMSGFVVNDIMIEQIGEIFRWVEREKEYDG